MCERQRGSRTRLPAAKVDERSTRWWRRHRTQSANSRETSAKNPTDIRDAATRARGAAAASGRSSSSLLDQNQALLACRPAYTPMPVPIVLTRNAANVPATAPMDQPIHPPIIAPESARTLDMCVGVVGSSGMGWLVGASKSGWLACCAASNRESRRFSRCVGRTTVRVRRLR